MLYAAELKSHTNIFKSEDSEDIFFIDEDFFFSDFERSFNEYGVGVIHALEFAAARNFIVVSDSDNSIFWAPDAIWETFADRSQIFID